MLDSSNCWILTSFVLLATLQLRRSLDLVISLLNSFESFQEDLLLLPDFIDRLEWLFVIMVLQYLRNTLVSTSSTGYLVLQLKLPVLFIIISSIVLFFLIHFMCLLSPFIHSIL